MAEGKRKELGRLGEDLACKTLSQSGYEMIERNYSCRYGEIDLIAKKDACLYFVEVKTKKDGAYCLPQENIDSFKQKKIRLAAENYLTQTNYQGECGFLAVLILWQQQKIEVLEVGLY